MEGGRYNRQRREAMRRRRARQVRKQIAVIGGIAIFLVLTVVIVSINLYKGSKEKKQRALVKAAVEECYAAFSASKEEEVPAAKIEKEQADFAEWFVKHYTDQTEGALLKKSRKRENLHRKIYMKQLEKHYRCLQIGKRDGLMMNRRQKNIRFT